MGFVAHKVIFGANGTTIPPTTRLQTTIFHPRPSRWKLHFSSAAAIDFSSAAAALETSIPTRSFFAGQVDRLPRGAGGAGRAAPWRRKAGGLGASRRGPSAARCATKRSHGLVPANFSNVVANVAKCSKRTAHFLVVV